MPALIIIPLAAIIVLFFASGSALTSQNQSQAHGSFWTDLLLAPVALTVWTVEESVKLAKYIAHYMFPALRSAEKAVAGWFAGHATIIEWQGNHAHRNSVALQNTVDWAKADLHDEILAKAKHDAAAEATKNALTKAPPTPQRRLTQHEVDAEFQKLIDGAFKTKLGEDFPKFDWEPGRWLKWLGIAPAVGGIILHPQPTYPKPKPKTHTVAPPIPVTTPHTDDHPNPDPGTQHVPGVVSGKDKWARGQIVKLNKKQTSILKHLGPLAFLALPIGAVATLIGLLECRNFSRFLNPFCSMPAHLLTDLLALITDFFILTDICEVITIVDDAFGVIVGPLTDFVDEAVGALCNGKYPAHDFGPLLYSTAAPELNTLAL